MSYDRITFTIGKALWLTSNRPISNRGYLQRVRNELHQMAATFGHERDWAERRRTA